MKEFIRSELTGIRNTVAVAKRLAAGITDAAQFVTVNVAQAILGKAKYYCPIDTGLLNESGRIETHAEAGQFYVAEVVFGSVQAFYAIYVHEDPTAYHKPPTRYKFLQVAIEESSKEIRDIINITFNRPDFNKVKIGPIGGIEVLTERTERTRHKSPTTGRMTTEPDVTYGHPGGHGRVHQLQPRGARGGRGSPFQPEG